MERSPIIEFDVNNSEHRKDLVTFMKTNSFSQCKNRYTLKGMYGDVLSMMKDKVLNYYINKEFPSTSK